MYMSSKYLHLHSEISNWTTQKPLTVISLIDGSKNGFTPNMYGQDSLWTAADLRKKKPRYLLINTRRLKNERRRRRVKRWDVRLMTSHHVTFRVLDEKEFRGITPLDTLLSYLLHHLEDDSLLCELGFI